MWNLNADDIQRAKEEINGRRSAIQARYDSEIKQLAADLAALETFEKAAVNFVSNFKGADGAAAGEASAPAAAADEGAASEPGGDAAPAAAERGASRWRMRLGSQDAAQPSEEAS